MERKPIKYLVATVRMPLYEGDTLTGRWDEFVYEEPGFNGRGELAVCRRAAETLSFEIVDA